MARTDRVAAYIDALNLRAIVVRRSQAGPFCKVGFSSEFRPTRIKPPADLAAERWFAKPAHAEIVTMTCRTDLRDIGAIRDQGWIDLPASEVVEKIDITARMLGAGWMSAAEIEKNADAAVRKVESQVELMRVNGDLQNLNQRYKAYRQLQVNRNERAMSYGKFLDAFVFDMVEQAAKISAGSSEARAAIAMPSEERWTDLPSRGKSYTTPNWSGPSWRDPAPNHHRKTGE